VSRDTQQKNSVCRAVYELGIAEEHLTIPRRRADLPDSSGKGSPPCFSADL